MKKLAGSSLVEILISILIVGLVVTSLAALLAMNVKNNSEVELRKHATSYAQDGVDIVRKNKATQTWSNFTSSGANGCVNDDGSDATTNIGSITLTRKCTLLGIGPNRELTVTVTWTEGGQQRDVVLKQKFFNR